jgi:cellobiose phosphorylase
MQRIFKKTSIKMHGTASGTVVHILMTVLRWVQSKMKNVRLIPLPQSWSVISKGGNPEYALKAMEFGGSYLIRKDDGLIQLFDPPFDKSDLNPVILKDMSLV